MGQYSLYLFLVWLTGGVALGLAFLGYRRSGDSFHPALILGIPLAYPYFLAPLLLHSKGILDLYLPMEWMAYVQFLDLLGIASLLLGTLKARNSLTTFYKPELWSQGLTRPLRSAALVLGIIGLVGYLVSVYSSGGFAEVYSVAHRGEGLKLSGYIRDSKWFLVPAILLLFLSSCGRQLKSKDIGLIAMLAAPLIFRAIVLGSRATTFIIVVTLVVGLYMSRGRRPRLITVLAGGTALGVLLLILVTHRQVLYLGEEFQFKGTDEAIEFIGRNSRGHEYIYGSGTIINSILVKDYEWGGRYIEKIVVRAIPGFLWPSQYEDIRNFLGLPENRLTAQVAALGWSATGGASTGLIADLWRQFWWFYLLILYWVGRIFGAFWTRAVSRGGIWFLTYTLMLAISLNLTQQTFQAWLWKLLFLGGISWIVWRFMVYPHFKKIQVYFYTQKRGMFLDSKREV